MDLFSAQQPYPGMDTPGSPGGMDSEGLRTRTASIPVSRAAPVGQRLDISDPAPGAASAFLEGPSPSPRVGVPAAGPGSLITGIQGPGAGGPLENYANNSSTPGQRHDHRSRRYARRSLLWSESSLPRVRKCGKVTRSEGGRVAVRNGATGAGFAGLCTCGSVWACSVCNAKIMARRRLELEAVIALHMARGGRVVFGTLTVRHHRGHSLDSVWDAVAQSWSDVTRGRSYLDWVSRGLLGFARAVEVTQGANGWHVHVHYLLFVPGDWPADGIGSFIVRRWRAAVARRGFEALDAAQDFRLVTGPADVDLSAYLSKSTDLGWELTSTQTKTAGRTLPVWDLLTRIESAGDADALDLWHEWERSSKGRRQLTWSHGLRELFGLARDLRDEEIAAEVVGDEDLVLIEPEGWSSLIARPHLIPRVLDAAESGGLDGLRRFLDSHGVAYVVAGI